MKIVVKGEYGQLGNEIKTLSGNFPSWQFFFRDVDTLDITNEKEVEFLQNQRDHHQMLN